jgi:MFS family permease
MSDSYAAERWFLSRGLPAVVRPAALVRRVPSRSAPALAALAMVAANSILIVAISGEHTVDIAGRPDLSESFVLGLLAVLLPAAAVTGWLVGRIGSRRRRLLAAGVSVVVIATGALFGGPSSRTAVNVVIFAVAIALIGLCTATGVGSILGWVAELAVSNIALTAGMFVRALPVVLLTFLVFFNTYVWLMTSLITRGRLWLGMGFLFLLAGSFLVTATLDRVRPLLAAPQAVGADPSALTGTPFDRIPDPDHTDPLSVRERLNTVFVVAASQLVHVLTVAVMTGAVFFTLGLILVSPPVLDAWTRGNGRPDGELLGMTLPVPDSLIQTTMLLTAITFMYLSAKAVTDAQYRAQFLEPMLDNLGVTLRARARYRASRQDMTTMGVRGG